MLIRLC